VTTALNRGRDGGDKPNLMGTAITTALRTFLLAPLLLVLFAAAFLALIAVAMMDSSFESGGLREWWYVRGTLNARLGLVEPVGPVRYHYEPPDGPGLASISAAYMSRRTPAEIVATYEEACGAQVLAITSRKSIVPASHPDEKFVQCDGKAGQVHVTATPGDAGTAVSVLVMYYR
jgi:hypothetical protein